MPKFETFRSLVRWHGTEKCERGAKHNSVGQDGPQQASEEPEESKGEPCAHLGGLTKASTKASELMVYVSTFFSRYFAWGVPHLIEILAPQKVPLCTPTHENKTKNQKKINRRKPYLNSRASHFEVIRGQIGHIEAGSLESMFIG